jgi:hypothetical protein
MDRILPRDWWAAIRPTERSVAALVVTSLIAVLLSVAAFVSPSAAVGAVPGGPVILDGNDPADHTSAAGPYMRDVYDNLNANLAPGYVSNGQVAVIGSCGSRLTTMGVTETLVEFNTAAAVEGLFLNIAANNYKIIHICSDDDSTLSLSVETELDKWGGSDRGARQSGWRPVLDRSQLQLAQRPLSVADGRTRWQW